MKNHSEPAGVIAGASGASPIAPREHRVKSWILSKSRSKTDSATHFATPSEKIHFPNRSECSITFVSPNLMSSKVVFHKDPGTTPIASPPPEPLDSAAFGLFS